MEDNAPKAPPRAGEPAWSAPAITAPLVSVVIPAYNAADFLGDCLRSCFQQSLQAMEVVVVDDGSTDRTPELLAEAAAREPRLRVVRQANSGKPAIARNVGVRAARGEFICFLDADDYYLPGRLERPVTLLRSHPELNLVFGDLRRVGGTSAASWLGGLNFRRDAGDHLSLINGNFYRCDQRFHCFASAVLCPLHTSAVTLRRAWLLQEPVLFPEDMLTGEDIDLWFRLLRRGGAAFLDEALSVYRDRGGSVTQDKEAFYLGTLRAHLDNLQRVGPELTAEERRRYLRRISRRYLHLGYLYVQREEPRAARSAYLKSLSLRPNVEAVLRLVKSTVAASLRRGRRRRPALRRPV